MLWTLPSLQQRQILKRCKCLPKIPASGLHLLDWAKLLPHRHSKRALIGQRLDEFSDSMESATEPLHVAALTVQRLV